MSNAQPVFIFFSLCSICFDPSIIRRDLVLFSPKRFCLPKPEKGGISYVIEMKENAM